MGFGVGYRFDPHDYELIQSYLIPKIELGSSFDSHGFITDADVYAHEPQDLIAQARYNSGDDKFYFFADRTAKGGKRAKRTLTLDGERRGGTWKNRDRPIPVLDRQGHQVGTRRTLTYVRNGETTPTAWRIHEFTLEVKGGRNKNSSPSSSSVLGKRKGASGFLDHVVCRLHLKEDSSLDEEEKSAHHQQYHEEHHQPQYMEHPAPSCFYSYDAQQYHMQESSCSYSQFPPRDQHQTVVSDCPLQQNQMEVPQSTSTYVCPEQQQEQLDTQFTMQSALSYTEMLLSGSDFPDFAEEGFPELTEDGMKKMIATYSQCVAQ
ncbi:hypothetical protein ACHQM5_007571 [Ranunculus cassubicifolius]